VLVVLVTGSRSWEDRETIYNRLAEINQPFMLIHGGAPGVDTIAGDTYKGLTGQHPIVVRPKYNKYYFKIAPKMRNIEMLEMLVKAREQGDEVLVLGFKDLASSTGGTMHCIDEAKERDIPVEVTKKIAS
jgi:hypothetical protein